MSNDLHMNMNGYSAGGLNKSTTEERQFIRAGRYPTDNGPVDLYQVRNAYGSVSGWQVRAGKTQMNFSTKNEALGYITRNYKVTALHWWEAER